MSERLSINQESVWDPIGLTRKAAELYSLQRRPGFTLPTADHPEGEKISVHNRTTYYIPSEIFQQFSIIIGPRHIEDYDNWLDSFKDTTRIYTQAAKKPSSMYVSQYWIERGQDNTGEVWSPGRDEVIPGWATAALLKFECLAENVGIA